MDLRAGPVPDRRRPGPAAPAALPAGLRRAGLHFHADGRPHTNAAYRAVETALAGRADVLALVSQEDHEACRRSSIGRRTRVWRLPGAGVPVADTPLRRPADGARRRALFVGELNANKDPETAVLAVAQRRREDPRWEIDLYGEGPLRARLEARYATSWCRVHGHSDRVAEALGQAHVLLAPSRREGLPRVVLEALATGLPVVARSNRGTRELLGRVGTLLPATAGPAEYADALARLADAPPDPAVLRAQALPYDEGEFRHAYGRLVDAVERLPA